MFCWTTSLEVFSHATINTWKQFIHIHPTLSIGKYRSKWPGELRQCGWTELVKVRHSRKRIWTLNLLTESQRWCKRSCRIWRKDGRCSHPSKDTKGRSYYKTSPSLIQMTKMSPVVSLRVQNTACHVIYVYRLCHDPDVLSTFVRHGLQIVELCV